MSRLSRTFGVPFTLTAYLLAVTVASSHYHGHEHVHPGQHSHVESSQVSSECHAHCHAGHGHAGHAHGHCGHSHAHVSTESHSHGHPHHHHGGFPHEHHDDCVVCQFLALKTVSTPLVTVVGLTETLQFTEDESVVQPDAPTLGLPLSRGPPAPAAC